MFWRLQHILKSYPNYSTCPALLTAVFSPRLGHQTQRWFSSSASINSSSAHYHESAFVGNVSECGRLWRRMVEMWSCAPLCHCWSRGHTLQPKDEAGIEGQWPLKLPQWALAEAIWGSPEGSPLSLWRMSADSCCTISFHLALPHADFPIYTGLWLPFGVCLLQRYLLVNFKTVRGKNLNQRCSCYLQRLLLDPDCIKKLNRKSHWYLGTKIFGVKLICVHCNLLIMYLISPYFRAAVNLFPLKTGHRWSCGTGGGGGCSWHYWGRSGISLACVVNTLRVKPVTRFNSDKQRVWLRHISGWNFTSGN